MIADAEIEQTLLGEVLRAGDKTLPALVATLEPEQFGYLENQLVYNACTQLFRRNDPVDVVSVSEFLAVDGTLAQAGGRFYLASLTTSGECLRPGWYAEKIRQAHVRRELCWLAENAGELAAGDPAEALQTIQDGINTLSGVLNPKSQTTTQDLIRQALRGIQDEEQGVFRGPLTGFRSVDEKQKGLTPGDLVVIAGRPAMGKSAFALNIASNVAIRENKPVLFYSLEMEPVDLMTRILRSEAQTGYRQQALSAVTVPDHYRILDTPNLDLVKFKGSILEHQAQLGEIGLVVVDYLQLMHAEGANLVEKTTRISNGLKAIARETKTCVVALSQLSRASEARQDKRPIPSDLRESGSIEQDADEVMLLYRHEYYHPGEKTGEAEVIFAKNRDGETGLCPLNFRPGISRFSDKRPVLGVAA